jgi:hypothetical protein
MSFSANVLCEEAIACEDSSQAWSEDSAIDERVISISTEY